MGGGMLMGVVSRRGRRWGHRKVCGHGGGFEGLWGGLEGAMGGVRGEWGSMGGAWGEWEAMGGALGEVGGLGVTLGGAKEGWDLGKGGAVSGVPPLGPPTPFFLLFPPPQPHPNVKPMMYANTLLQLGMM